MQELALRLGFVKALTEKGQIKEKSDRLSVLVRELPEAQDSYDRAKYTLVVQERLLEERGTILLTQCEGKNEDARKAALLAAKQGDRDWQQLQNIVIIVRGQVLDAALVQERLKREWVALTIQIHVFTSTLEFLAGAKEKEETTHAG